MTTTESASGGLRHGTHGRFQPAVDSAERTAAALRLFSQGATFWQIAAKLGYADESGARAAVRRGLASIVRPTADEARAMIEHRYEVASAALMETITSPPPLAQLGKVVRDDDGQPVPDKDARRERLSAWSGWTSGARARRTVSRTWPSRVDWFGWQGLASDAQ